MEIIPSQGSVGSCMGQNHQWSQLLHSFYLEVSPFSETHWPPPLAFQERQRLETILSLCAEYTKPDSRLSLGTTVADVQKINKELEKLQISDEDSVFEEALGNPDVRYRCHQKSAGQDADVAAFGSLSQSSAGFLSPRSAMNEELLRDLSRTPPPPASAFLKASNESSYLSILPKVKETARRLGLRAHTWASGLA